MAKNLQSKTEAVYQFAPLDAYSLRERLLIHLADWTFYLLIKIIGGTTRFAAEGWENLEQLERQSVAPIYVFWHDRIFLSVYYFRFRSMVVMTSQSFDGEYIARFIRRFGFGAIRGSSTRGGVKALVEMIRLLRAGLPMTFTADGPKGPRYLAKPGAILLAKKTGNPIIACSVEPRKFWTLGSWDKMQIPKPFTRAQVFVSEPIYVSTDADQREIEKKRLELQYRLDESVKLGKQWRDSFDK